MTIRHHPKDSLRLAYVAGQMDPATALIMATHLSLCAQCRAAAADDECIGGALLEGAEPMPLRSDALARVMARLGAPEAIHRTEPSADGTPAPLRAFLGHELSCVRWRRLGPRLGYVTLYRRGSLAMRLLRGAPGTEVGQHTHRGTEYTVVLRGGYSDESGNYGPGDFQIASADLTHNPVADVGEDCINLAVTDGGLQFRSRVQNVVASLFGF
ncbi:MAG: hypothetical protein BGN85_10155 [Alphaproteobacteria bacterium 64-11]|nr:cupin domain-containing protein [Alphaproteobacteria bacterium]OJU13102.1 MAG: hypothetical protein BGN85_10155 [Alphaproteobacteria bacterium 64-11]